MKIFRYLFSPVGVIFLLPLILITIWFSNGHFLASGEAAIPFATLSRHVELTQNAWSEYALGNYPGFISASYPTYYSFNFLSELGIPGFILEAIFFYIIFVVAGLSIYCLVGEIFSSVENIFKLSAVFFYWFNPFSLVNIWNRFLYNHMVFFAYYPLMIFLLIRGIRKNDYKFAYFMGLVSLLFSYASTSPALDFLLWFTIGIIVIFKFIWEKNIKKRIFIILFSLLTLIIYCLFNLWWISQMFSYTSSSQFAKTTNTFFNSTENIDTLQNISNRLGNMTDVFRLMHHDFFQSTNNGWADFYNRGLSQLFELTCIFLIFLAVSFNLMKKNVILVTFFVFLGWFLMKGAMPPFENIFIAFFINFPIIQFFRNPFEKIGFIVPIFLSILIAFSFDWYFRIINNNKVVKILRHNSIYFSNVQKKISIYNDSFLLVKNIFIFFIIIASTFFYAVPFLTGKVFTYQNNSDQYISYEVDIPEFYKQADNWLLNQSGMFRLLVLPIGNEGISYNWSKPFSGVESTNTLLHIPAISYNTTIPYYNDISKRIQEWFLFDSDFITKAKKLNIRYIVLRQDILIGEREMIDPILIREALTKYENAGIVKKIKTFGDLEFWEIVSWKDQTVSVESNINPVSPYQNFSVIGRTAKDNIQIGSEISNSVATNIFPSDEIKIQNEISAGYEYDQVIFPYVSYLSTDSFFPLILVKENFTSLELFNIKQKLERKIFLLGKRVSEMNRSLDEKNDLAFTMSLTLYNKQLKLLETELVNYLKSPDSSVKNWRDQTVYRSLQRHIVFFGNVKVNVKNKFEVDQTKDALIELLKKTNILPQGQIKKSELFDIFDRSIYKYDNVESKSYMVSSLNIVDLPIGTNIPFEFQINNALYKGNAVVQKNRSLYFGEFPFQNGANEISINPLLINQIRSQSNPSLNLIEIPLDKFHSSSIYKLQLNYDLTKGSSILIQLVNDNDPIKKGENIASFEKEINSESNQKKYEVELTTRPGSLKSKIRIVLKNVENCRLNEEQLLQCQNGKIYNLKVERLFKAEPMLSKIMEPENMPTPVIKYFRLDASNYEVSVKNAEGKYILSLSELFHPGWRLYIDNKEVKDHVLVDGYANGWIIDKKGSYNLKISFIPNYYYRLFIFISEICIMLTTLIFIFRGRFLKK